jgi:hypothetical protein
MHTSSSWNNSDFINFIFNVTGYCVSWLGSHLQWSVTMPPKIQLKGILPPQGMVMFGDCTITQDETHATTTASAKRGFNILPHTVGSRGDFFLLSCRSLLTKMRLSPLLCVMGVYFTFLGELTWFYARRIAADAEDEALLMSIPKRFTMPSKRENYNFVRLFWKKRMADFIVDACTNAYCVKSKPRRDSSSQDVSQEIGSQGIRARCNDAKTQRLYHEHSIDSYVFNRQPRCDQATKFCDLYTKRTGVETIDLSQMCSDKGKWKTWWPITKEQMTKELKTTVLMPKYSKALWVALKQSIPGFSKDPDKHGCASVLAMIGSCTGHKFKWETEDDYRHLEQIGVRALVSPATLALPELTGFKSDDFSLTKTTVSHDIINALCYASWCKFKDYKKLCSIVWAVRSSFATVGTKVHSLVAWLHAYRAYQTELWLSGVLFRSVEDSGAKLSGGAKPTTKSNNSKAVPVLKGVGSKNSYFCEDTSIVVVETSTGADTSCQVIMLPYVYKFWQLLNGPANVRIKLLPYVPAQPITADEMWASIGGLESEGYSNVSVFATQKTPISVMVCIQLFEHILMSRGTKRKRADLSTTIEIAVPLWELASAGGVIDFLVWNRDVYQRVLHSVEIDTSELQPHKINVDADHLEYIQDVVRFFIDNLPVFISTPHLFRESFEQLATTMGRVPTGQTPVHTAKALHILASHCDFESSHEPEESNICGQFPVSPKRPRSAASSVSPK